LMALKKGGRCVVGEGGGEEEKNGRAQRRR
jgi:hypothetical protein